jgi:hypothetical protein
VRPLANLIPVGTSVLAAVIAAAMMLVAGAGVEAQTADARLGDFIQLNMFTSPYAGAQIPMQWCYTSRTDQAYDWWYLQDSASTNSVAVQAQSAFAIPFTPGAAYASGTIGAIVVGYIVDGGTPMGGLSNVAPPTPKTPGCAIGSRILTNGPYPIVGLATDIAHQASVDPAPEYRYWIINGTYHRVRLIQVIPISFQIGNSAAAGRLVLALTGDW